MSRGPRLSTCEQDVYYTRIGDYDCNVNGVGDADDLLAGTSVDLDGDGILDECQSLGTRYCTPAIPNSTGLPGVLSVNGSAVVADDDLVLTATQLPPGPNTGYFIMGTGTNTFVPPGAVGPICVTPGLERYLPPTSSTAELNGGFTRDVGTSGPISSSITPGSTWNFQAWHRDGMDPSNFTDAVSVTFR